MCTGHLYTWSTSFSRFLPPLPSKAFETTVTFKLAPSSSASQEVLQHSPTLRMQPRDVPCNIIRLYCARA